LFADKQRIVTMQVVEKESEEVLRYCL